MAIAVISPLCACAVCVKFAVTVFALFMVTSQGDYTILGHVYNTEAGLAAVVGIYFFAYNLCIQTTQFITSNLANVLLPAFSKLQHETERLKRAFLRSTKMLAIVGVFICLLQAAVGLSQTHPAPKQQAGREESSGDENCNQSDEFPRAPLGQVAE